MIRVITYFGGSFLPLRQSKALYKVGFFEEITGDLQKKAEFATRIINTSALPCVYMITDAKMVHALTFDMPKRYFLKILQRLHYYD